MNRKTPVPWIDSTERGFINCIASFLRKLRRHFLAAAVP